MKCVSAFNPSKCTHLEQRAADCAAPGEQSWTSYRSRDSNPQPWVTSGFKSNALSIRPRLPVYAQCMQVYALATHQQQVERRESQGANQVYALTTHQLQVKRRESHGANQVDCARHTPATGGEERES